MNATLGYHDQTLQGRRMDFFDTFLNETPWHSTFDWTPVVEKHHGGQILEVKIIETFRLIPVNAILCCEEPHVALTIRIILDAYLRIAKLQFFECST